MGATLSPLKLPRQLGFWVGGSWGQPGNDWLGPRSTSGNMLPRLRWRSRVGGGWEAGREKEKGGGGREGAQAVGQAPRA